ncbi:MAG: hypothetical protein ABSF96_15040 [Steroidobacteraceae bacterium]|jgi:predicted outer membrane protein
MKTLLLTAATTLGLLTVLLPLTPTKAAEPGAALGPTDTYFVTQTSLATPFQVDAGRIAEPI